MESAMIIAVSAGQMDWKKNFDSLRKRIRYLNYGLLGLVTMINEYSESKIKMYQAESGVEELIEDIRNSGVDLKKDCSYVLLSIPSIYSVSWAAHFCDYLHFNTSTKIIVGGRWAVDGHREWIADKLKYADVIIESFGEEIICSIFDLKISTEKRDGARNCFDHFDYSLLYHYERYSPSIEISRGCGSGCAFCLDASSKRLKNKSVSLVMKELDELDQLYKNDYNVYLEAPHFVFERKWVREFCEAMKQRRRVVPWRCTTRVESVPVDMIGELAESGLKVIDVGLESASLQQLSQMGKTPNPAEYLKKAETLLKACSEYDIWVKFNLLLYAGETENTVRETAEWLRKNATFIKDVSVSSLVFYYGMGNLKELEALGASVPEGQNIEKTGYIALNLSDEIKLADTQRIGHELACIVADQKDFYDIKAFSYFEPNYTYEDFLIDLKESNPAILPFCISI